LDKVDSQSVAPKFLSADKDDQLRLLQIESMIPFDGLKILALIGMRYDRDARSSGGIQINKT